MEPVDNSSSRRPLKSRSSPYARRAASFLAARGATPNGISVAGIVFALLSLPAMALRSPVGYALAACCIQARLLCNLLDGMVAVEHGKGSKDGALFNEVPDRIADSIFLAGAGYAFACPEAGLAAALCACLTAYLRALGASLTGAQEFCGPMAKPHRMALLTAAFVLVCFLPDAFNAMRPANLAMQAVLWAIAAGSLATCARRLARIRRRLNGSAA